MSKRYTVVEFRELPVETQQEVLKDRKVMIVTDDLVDDYRKSLYEELVTVANSVSPKGDAEDVEVEWEPGSVDDNARIGVQLSAGAETMYFSSYAEAFAALEAAKPKPLNIDYKGIEERTLREAGVEVEVHDNKALALVVMDADGNPQVFHDVNEALAAAAKVRATRVVPDFSETAVALQKHQGISMQGHVHGPNCVHEHHHDHLPQVEGLEELMRVNPEMGSTPFRDGEMLQLPSPNQAPDYIIKDGSTELSAKQKGLLDNFVKVYNAWHENPQNSSLRREAKDLIYRLGTAGIILNPKFTQVLAQGAKQVRDARKLMKFGGSVQELTTKADNTKSTEKSA